MENSVLLRAHEPWYVQGQDSRRACAGVVDNFRTPHSDKLHMVERIRLVEDGNFLEADITIEDPAVFIKPLQVTKRSRRVEASIIEWRCAAGEMGNPFADASDPIPVAAKAEF